MPKTNKNYKEKDVEAALLAIKNGQMTKKAASKNFKIPRSTLQFRLSSKFTKTHPGPATVLTDEEEATIAEWLKVSQEKGFPKRKEDVIYAVQEFLRQSNREHPFGSEAIPGKGWFRSFLNRHNTLTFRAVDPLSSASTNVAVTDIFGWFDSIQNYLIKNDFFVITNVTWIEEEKKKKEEKQQLEKQKEEKKFRLEQKKAKELEKINKVKTKKNKQDLQKNKLAKVLPPKAFLQTIASPKKRYRMKTLPKDRSYSKTLPKNRSCLKSTTKSARKMLFLKPYQRLEIM